MGVSTDGILAFGIDMGEGEVSVPWDNTFNEETEEEGDRDIESWWVKTVAPELETEYEEIYKDYPEDDYSNWKESQAKREAWQKANKEKTDDYWNRRREVIATLPVEEIIHCSYDYPMYFLAVKGESYSASRGYPEQIDSLEVTHVQVIEAQKFCKKYCPELNFSNPKWYLASLWG